MDFTCFNYRPVIASSNTDQFIGGYKGNEDIRNAAVSFGREVRTGPGGTRSANMHILCTFYIR